jgi:thiamine pyrophosphate-dependent acetolactate synthase large subunit-like protein
MSQTVAGTLVEVLEEIGVRQIFGLIGDSMNPLADAVRHSSAGCRAHRGATSPRETPCSFSTPDSTRSGRATGSARAASSGSSARSTIAPSAPRLARPTASGRSTVRARSSPSAANGGFNMLMCEFLTDAQHKLPVKAVVYNNSALAAITLEAEAKMGLPAWKEAIDFPNPNYVGLARECGGVGFKAEKPGELRDAIDKGLKADGPAIIDCVVPADESPNVPHLDLETMENYAEAKVKEEILALIGW